VVEALKLESLTQVPNDAASLRAMVDATLGPRVPRRDDAHVRRDAALLLDVLVFAALSAMGWSAELQPAAPVRFKRGDETLEPEARVAALVTGSVSARSEWADFCIAAGLADFDLGLLLEAG
jgi:hypothetical protein